MQREMSVNGAFYPDNSTELKNTFDFFNTTLKDQNTQIPKLNPRAIIVPHAGYVYSGYTANLAYKSLNVAEEQRLIVLGPSHRVRFDDMSISDFKEYKTPLGNIEIDTPYIQKLKDKFNITCKEDAHKEHSTEVQMPFIKYYFNNTKVVELVYSNISVSKICDIVEFILKDEKNILVVSTDLSHYYDIQKATNLDNIFLEAIENIDIERLTQGCEACGILGVYALLKSANTLGLKSTMLDYRTSADASGDNSSVVGYMSAAFE